MIPCWGAWWKSSLFRLREKAIFKMLHYSLDQALSKHKKHNQDPHHLFSWKISFHIYISSASSIGFTKSVCGMRPSNIIQLVLLLKHKWQGRPSRGFQGGTCTPAFLPSPGNSYIRKKNCMYMIFIFPKIPRLMHPCYLGRMGAPVNVTTFWPAKNCFIGVTYVTSLTMVIWNWN